MEPALQGRDDLVPPPLVTIRIRLPQWSPPFRGGMTGGGGVAIDYVFWPQWSPPFRGGMTALAVAVRVARAEAAMEPALQGRDDTIVPSW